MLYYLNEAAFSLPDVRFKDATVHRLTCETPSGAELTVMAIRVPRKANQSLADAVTQHQEWERRTLRAWEPIYDRALEIDGQPAIEVAVRWRAETGLVYHRQIHIALEEILLIGISGPLAERERCDAIGDELLATFRLRTE